MKALSSPPAQKNGFNVFAGKDDISVAVRLAMLWNKYIPRGKGWFPRFIGKVAGKHLRNYMITKHGAILAIEPMGLDVYVHILNHGRTWNEYILDACVSSLSKGDVFYDIGANIGYVSIEIAKLFNDQIRVVSFEPQPELSRIIGISAELNGFKNVQVFDLMLGFEEEETDLYLTSHSIHASAVPREKKYRLIKRKITTIDGLVDSGMAPPPKVIKMDIEGGELKAFLGAKRTIAKYQPCIIFESDTNMRRYGYERSDILSLLKGLGPYSFFFLSSNGEYIPITELNIADDYSDILAKPDGKQ